VSNAKRKSQVLSFIPIKVIITVPKNENVSPTLKDNNVIGRVVLSRVSEYIALQKVLTKS
jgi:hypothetical protein